MVPYAIFTAFFKVIVILFFNERLIRRYFDVFSKTTKDCKWIFVLLLSVVRYCAEHFFVFNRFYNRSVTKTFAARLLIIE